MPARTGNRYVKLMDYGLVPESVQELRRIHGTGPAENRCRIKSLRAAGVRVKCGLWDATPQPSALSEARWDAPRGSDSSPQVPTMQKRITTTIQWMAAAFAIAVVIVLVVRLDAGSDARLGSALRATARWSYVLFWLSYVGGALVTLFGARFRPLAERGRDFGLSFASAHQVHLGLVGWGIVTRELHPTSGAFVFFGLGALSIYVLLLFSLVRVSAVLSPRVVRFVRTLGVEYIAFVFLSDFAKNPFDSGLRHAIAYLPFLALAVIGPLLRIAAVVKRWSASRSLATP